MAPMEQRRRRDAEHRLRRALEGYLDGVITAKELEEIRTQCSPEAEPKDNKGKEEPLRIPEVSAELWGDILRETVARVTVYQDSLKMVFRVGEKSLQIWYATSGKGVYYRTDIRRWEEKKRPEK